VKTAVSIPTPLFRAAERTAAELGLSRSGLYARALRRYLSRYRYAGVTERLNAIYEHEPARADRVLLAAQWRRAADDEGSAEW
jgi:metal-responsive CopG/Arc/MetJ family transcriptional regulator